MAVEVTMAAGMADLPQFCTELGLVFLIAASLDRWQTIVGDYRTIRTLLWSGRVFSGYEVLIGAVEERLHWPEITMRDDTMRCMVPGSPHLGLSNHIIKVSQR